MRPGQAAARRWRADAGFTIVELLVVVLIAGLLAAVAIPVYFLGQAEAKNAGVESDLRNAKTAVMNYWTAKGESAPAPTFDDAAGTGLVAHGWVRTPSSTASVSFGSGSSPTPKSFCIQATGVTSRVFHVSTTSGVDAGGC